MRIVRARSVKLPRWEVWLTSQAAGSPSLLLALLNGAIHPPNARTIAKAFAGMVQSPVALLHRKRGSVTAHNPTLVHHGYIGAASFHLLSEGGTPLADIYTEHKTVAREIARVFANELGYSVHVLDNEGQPGEGAGNITHTHRTVAKISRRTNPSRHRGARWTFVSFSAREIRAFTESWPASGLRKLGALRLTIDQGDVIASRPAWFLTDTNVDQGAREALIADAQRIATSTNPSRSLAARKRRRIVRELIPRRERRAGASGRYDRSTYLAEQSRRRTIARDTANKIRRGRGNPRRAIGATYDALGNGIGVRSVLVGTGLANAGRSYTVLAMKGLRVLLEPHLGGKPFWTFARHYRVDTASNPRRSRRANPAARLAPGTRVRATIYGTEREGTVLEQRSAGIVWVRWDGSTRQAWTHRDSLTVINPSRSRRAKLVRKSMVRAFNRKERRAIAQESRGGARGKSRGVVSRHGARRKARTGSTLKATHRPRPNPSSAQLASAASTFRKWHDFAPHNVRRVKGRKAIPSVLVKLGEIVQFVYRSDKWSGKPVTYEHRTKLPRPQLCTGADGRGLYVIGGRTRVTARGLVD
jgi:hypothetical protein